MWLINVNTLKLEYVIELDPDVYKYAILSHRWAAEEVSFAEMNALTPGGTLPKAGFRKIRRCCEEAKLDGFEYAWVDTCCIDKSSSAELSESINSMFKWYQHAQVCYVYMDDVPDPLPSEDRRSDESEQSHLADAPPYKQPTDLRGFVESRWFTRGWTLQELIAPRVIKFFSVAWSMLGTKASLIEHLTRASSVDKDILLGTTGLHTVPIGRRMSWASDRDTTRTEDIAYCLLGIFDINMALLYGEGKKAFIRLQEEIARSSDDHTLFAWADSDARDDEPRGLLAPHPSCFRGSWCWTPRYKLLNKNVLRITPSNRGLTILASLFERGTTISGERQWMRHATLFCTTPEGRHATIVLNKPNGRYTARLKASSIKEDDGMEGAISEICVPQYPERLRIADEAPAKWLRVYLGASVSASEVKQLEADQIWVSPDVRMVSRDDLAHFPQALLPGRWHPAEAYYKDMNAYKFSFTEPGTTMMLFRVYFADDRQRRKPADSVVIEVDVLHDGNIGVGLRRGGRIEARPSGLSIACPTGTTFHDKLEEVTIEANDRLTHPIKLGLKRLYSNEADTTCISITLCASDG